MEKIFIFIIFLIIYIINFYITWYNPFNFKFINEKYNNHNKPFDIINDKKLNTTESNDSAQNTKIKFERWHFKSTYHCTPYKKNVVKLVNKNINVSTT